MARSTRVIDSGVKARDLEIVRPRHSDSCVSLETIIWTLSGERGPFLKHPGIFVCTIRFLKYVVSLPREAEYVNTAEPFLSD